MIISEGCLVLEKKWQATTVLKLYQENSVKRLFKQGYTIPMLTATAVQVYNGLVSNLGHEIANRQRLFDSQLTKQQIKLFSLIIWK